MHQEKSCGIIIFRSNDSREYLLVEQAQSGLWNFPKGHVEKGENEYETALREVLEETGLHITILDDFRETISYDESKEVHKTVVCFVGKVNGGKLNIPNDEISSYAWLSIEGVLSKVKFSNSKELFRKAEKFISNSH